MPKKKYSIKIEARYDIQEILSYIAADNPTAAHRMKARITQAFRTIGDSFHIGQRREDITALPVRFFPAHPNYLIVYEPATSPIHILRAFHSAQHIAKRSLP